MIDTMYYGLCYVELLSVLKALLDLVLNADIECKKDDKK